MLSITVMKVVMALTSKAIYFFSLTGNTKALIEQLEDLDEWDVFDLNTLDSKDVSFHEYDTILIGTLTLGRGTPPTYFKKLYSKLVSIENAKIGLFGSGQSHYGDDFCGALDVLEDVLTFKNDIVFKLKYESYPKPQIMEEFTQLVKEMEYSYEAAEV